MGWKPWNEALKKKAFEFIFRKAKLQRWWEANLSDAIIKKFAFENYTILVQWKLQRTSKGKIKSPNKRYYPNPRRFKLLPLTILALKTK